MSKINSVVISGLLIILAGILCNEWTLAKLFTTSGVINSPVSRIIILCFDLIAIAAGFLIIKYKPRNVMVLWATMLIFFVIIEAAYRALDPFPFIYRWERNHSDHGNLLQYDETLGWRGVPGGKEIFATINNAVLLRHNSAGFRDIEHKKENEKKEAIVFLGDSFTWGYEVDFNDMAVNILRKKLPRYEIFNLALNGYGTDQELLTFRKWHANNAIKLVILMCCENDFGDNNAAYRYSKFKPKYELRDGELVLTGVPVPKEDKWDKRTRYEYPAPSLKERLAFLIVKSYFIHDICFRLNNLEADEISKMNSKALMDKEANESSILTNGIIKQLRDDVIERKGHLIVIAIPSLRQFLRDKNYTPYQQNLEEICRQWGIEYLDLFPYFKRNILRSYYRRAMHWNERGHKIAAEAIYSYLNGKGM